MSPPVKDGWRKIIHCLVHGLMAWLILGVSPAVAAVMLVALAAISFVADHYRRNRGEHLNRSLRRLGDVVRPWEYGRPSGAVWSFVGMAVLMVTSWAEGIPPHFLALSALVLAFADPAAGLARTVVLSRGSSIVGRAVGAVAFATVSVPVVLLFTGAFPSAFAGLGTWTIALMVAMVAALTEAWSWKYVDDNATIPAATTLVLVLLLDRGAERVASITVAGLLLVVAMLLLNRPLSHRLAVAGMVVRDRRVLLLRRAVPPLIWAPPGGRLFRGEDPNDGVRREVLEECGLVVEPIRPVSVFTGDHQGEWLVGMSIACRYISGDIALSEENSESHWIDPADHPPGPIRIGDIPGLGSMEDYAWAVRLVGEAPPQVPV